ncbi:hypothetical protein NDU88_002295 [Pleurodeles waltl]|uniref:Uncharacterized protein n=1 Tax=Pleurodeles waltl TaxID=8319 RepID=A0AAV7VZ93_PLEWA|nr:hypothetical protein NDU88_002295 [Pleurodeles waltl]
MMQPDFLSEDSTQRLPCDRKLDAHPYRIAAQPNRIDAADSPSGKPMQCLPCDRKLDASPYRIDAMPVTSSSAPRISPNCPWASKRSPHSSEEPKLRAEKRCKAPCSVERNNASSVPCQKI